MDKNMLEKLFALDYQDYANILTTDIDSIKKYLENNNLNLDIIIGKYKNGLIPATIIANNLNLEVAIIKKTNDQFVFYKEHIDMLNIKTVLLVDSIIQSGNSITEIKNYINHLYPHITVITYAPIVNKQALKKPDLYGITTEIQSQLPWQLNYFTPQAQLDRLENNSDKTNIKNTICIGLDSDETYAEIKPILNKDKNIWYMSFKDTTSNFNTTSGISTMSINKKLDLKDAQSIYKKIINEKLDFINQHGLTHFIETNLEQAICIAEKSPICNIIYYNHGSFYKFFIRKVKF